MKTKGYRAKGWCFEKINKINKVEIFFKRKQRRGTDKYHYEWISFQLKQRFMWIRKYLGTFTTIYEISIYLYIYYIYTL